MEIKNFQYFLLECNYNYFIKAFSLIKSYFRSLNNMKIKLKGAQTGHSLLKRKSDALSSRFRGILARIRKAKYEMNDLLKGSALAMAQVNYAAGDISFAVREASSNGPAQFQVQTRVENVSGVQLPIFESHILSSSSNDNNANNTNSHGSGLDLTALSRGGQQVQKCREANQRFLQSLLNLASLQTAFHILEEVIQVTNRRVNALEYVILPKTENTINYITSELDEQDREEFFRLKKVQAKKKARESAEAEELNEEIDYSVENELILSNSILLDLENDPDIIF